MSWLVCVSRTRFLRPRPTHTHEPRLHPARPGHTVVGLERRHHPNQGAFHRIALDLAVKVDQSTRAFQLARPAPHPFACRDPIQPRQWHGGRFKLPRPRRIALRRPAWGTEKMRLPDVCNRPTTRAPFGSIDSRVRPRSALRPSFARRPSLQAKTRFDERAHGRSHERPRWSFA
jgi:hypothetical protein